MRERHERNYQQIDDVADHGQGPVPASLVGGNSAGQSQDVADQFPGARNDSDYGRRGAQRAEKWAVDAARTFVRDVGQKADSPEGDDKSNRRFTRDGEIGI